MKTIEILVLTCFLVLLSVREDRVDAEDGKERDTCFFSPVFSLS